MTGQYMPCCPVVRAYIEIALQNGSWINTTLLYLLRLQTARTKWEVDRLYMSIVYVIWIVTRVSGQNYLPLFALKLTMRTVHWVFWHILVPRPPTIQFLIAYSMQNWRVRHFVSNNKLHGGKAWERATLGSVWHNMAFSICLAGASKWLPSCRIGLFSQKWAEPIN